MKAFQSRPPRRPISALAVVAVVLVGSSPAAASASAHRASGKAPVNVLVIAAESGPLAAAGTAGLHGAVTAARILNASGGVLGHKVTLKIVDSASNPVT